MIIEHKGLTAKDFEAMFKGRKTVVNITHIPMKVAHALMLFQTVKELLSISFSNSL